MPRKDAPQPRRADAVFYNYATDQVIRQVVNLETRGVEATHSLPGKDHQPPVASTEAEAAVRMILAHPTLSQELQQAFLQATGEFLLRADQVRPQGILFVPSDTGNTRLSKLRGHVRSTAASSFFCRPKVEQERDDWPD